MVTKLKFTISVNPKYERMFSTKQNVKSTLLCGPQELSRSFMFEIACHWAEEGRRVIYITSSSIESLPPANLDKNNTPSSAAVLKLIRFMYLPNYDALAKQLIELPIFATLPSILLFDDLDRYLNDQDITVDRKIHVAKTCALILSSMNSCSKLLKMDVSISELQRTEATIKSIIKVLRKKVMKPRVDCQVQVCAWSSRLVDDVARAIYFRNVWHVEKDEKGGGIEVRELRHGSTKEAPLVFKYKQFRDGTRMLKQVLREITP